MSDAISGVGTSFTRGNGEASTETFTAIAEVNSISGPGMSRDFIDVTSLDSTGGYKEYIGGFRDGGTLSLNMNLTLAGYNSMKDDFEDDDSVNYQVVIPSTMTLDFAGFVTDLPMDITPGDKITCNVTIKITGEVTLDTT